MPGIADTRTGKEQVSQQSKTVPAYYSRYLELTSEWPYCREAACLVNLRKEQSKQQHDAGAPFEKQVLLSVGKSDFMTSFLADNSFELLGCLYE